MEWHRGLKRIRIVGTAALAAGIVFSASVYITTLLGFAPDLSVAPLFTLMGRLGLPLAILGGLLWVAVWIIQGFAPAPPVAVREPDTTPRRAHLDQ